MIKRDVAALIAFIDSRQGVPHAIGREANDCVSYVLAAVAVQTGSPAAPRLTWSSRTGAMRLIKHFGSLEAAFDAHFERIVPAFAKHGDIAGVPDEDFGIHPAIVEGDTIVGPGETGNQRMKRSAMTIAWSIERPKGAAA